VIAAQHFIQRVPVVAVFVEKTTLVIGDRDRASGGATKGLCLGGRVSGRHNRFASCRRSGGGGAGATECQKCDREKGRSTRVHNARDCKVRYGTECLRARGLSREILIGRYSFAIEITVLKVATGNFHVARESAVPWKF